MSRPRHSDRATVMAALLTLALASLAGVAAAATGQELFDRFLAPRAPSQRSTAPATTTTPAAVAPVFGSPGGVSVIDAATARPVTPLATFPGLPATGAKIAPPALDGIYIGSPAIDVASAGDVDGNGTTDWIRGEPYAANGGLTQAGHVKVYRTLPGGPPVELDFSGTTAFASFGGAVAPAGDVNGDGYDDVIVGSPGYDGTRGRALVLRGTPGGTSSGAPWIIEGVAAQDFTGYSVAGAGDVNGDGYDDVLVGSPGWSSDGTFYRGKVSCYLGSTTGLSLTAAWTVEGTQGNEQAGLHVAGNGDVNGDGYADVLVASPYYTNGETSEGCVKLYLGGPGGLAISPAFTFESNATFWGDGINCALPGDVNGDGYGDVVIGIPGADVGGTNDGEVLVFGGSPFTFFLPQLGFVYGGTDNMQYGYDVAPAGDLNGDGFADFLATAPFYGAESEGLWTESYGSTNYAFPSSFLVRYGSSFSYSGIAAAGGGDTGDGKQVYLLAVGEYSIAAPSNPDPDAGLGFSNPGMITIPGFTFDEIGYMPSRVFAQGSYLETGYGQSLAFADVNGDGYTDVIAGGPNYADTFSGQGHVDAYYGEPEGYAIPPFAARKGAGPTLLGTSTSIQIPDWSYVGQVESASLGFTVANAGDVNGDGYEDILVGAPGYSHPDGAEGAAYLFTGGPDGLSALPAWQTEGNEGFALHGYGLGAAGDVNQDGYDDILVGAPIGNGGTGKVNLYYGSPSGPAHTPARTFLGSGPDVHLGASCIGIGDVDSDGYPDIAMSEVDYSNGEVSEGRILAYKGGPGGVAALPFFTWETNNANSSTGFNLAPAGDVNGDGFADLLVDARDYSNGEAEEGAVHLFTGSALGLSGAPVTTLESNVPGHHFGTRVWSAGDMNKDGYGDVAIGIPDFGVMVPVVRHGEPETAGGAPPPEGRVEIYFGTPGGLESFPRIALNGSGAGFSGQFGAGLAGGGDVNGDGWPDIAMAGPYASVGKLFQNGALTVGFANVFADGLARPTRTLRSDNLTPIALGLRSDQATSFRVAALARTPAGRGKVRLQWQAKAPNAALDGTGIGSSAALKTSLPTPSGGSSITLGGTVSGLTSGQRYRVRTRLATKHPYFQRSPWFSAHRNGVRETDLRTAGPTGFVDVADPSAAPGALAFAGAWPNPMPGAGTLEYVLPHAGRVTIDAYDASGRRVARVHEGEAAAGPGAAAWDGRDDAGHALARGLYFLRLTFEGEAKTAKVVLAP